MVKQLSCLTAVEEWFIGQIVCFAPYLSLYLPGKVALKATELKYILTYGPYRPGETNGANWMKSI